MKKSWLLLSICFPIWLNAQSYEVIHGVSVELPYFKSVDDAIGQIVRLIRVHELIEDGLLYEIAFDSGKAKAKRIKKDISVKGLFRVERIETINKKNYLLIYDLDSPRYLGIICSETHDPRINILNENAKFALENYIQKNCAYQYNAGGKVYAEGSKISVHLPYIKCDFSTRINYSVWPFKIEILGGDGKIKDVYSLLENKELFISETEFDSKFWQAVKDKKERQQKEREDRLFAYIDKYGIDIGITIIKIEEGEIQEPWWWFGDKMTFLKMIYERYGAEITNNVLNGVVKLGYTAQICEVAWGEPDDINRTTFPWAIHEQWVYNKRKAYLYFENGKLVTIQD